MLLQNLGFVTTYSFIKTSIGLEKETLFLLRTNTKVRTKKKKINTMQPLTTWYEYRNHFTKTKLKICFTFFFINKKRLAFMEKIFI